MHGSESERTHLGADPCHRVNHDELVRSVVHAIERVRVRIERQPFDEIKPYRSNDYVGAAGEDQVWRLEDPSAENETNRSKAG